MTYLIFALIFWGVAAIKEGLTPYPHHSRLILIGIACLLIAFLLLVAPFPQGPLFR